MSSYSLLAVEKAYIQLKLSAHFPNTEKIQQELIRLGIWAHLIDVLEGSLSKNNGPELLLGKNLESDAVRIVKTVLTHCACAPRIAVIGSSASLTVYIGVPQPWKRRYLSED